MFMPINSDYVTSNSDYDCDDEKIEMFYDDHHSFNSTIQSWNLNHFDSCSVPLRVDAWVINGLTSFKEDFSPGACKKNSRTNS